MRSQQPIPHLKSLISLHETYLGLHVPYSAFLVEEVMCPKKVEVGIDGQPCRVATRHTPGVFLRSFHLLQL